MYIAAVCQIRSLSTVQSGTALDEKKRTEAQRISKLAG